MQLWTKKWLPGIFFINLRSGVSGCFWATVNRETDKSYAVIEAHMDVTLPGRRLGICGVGCFTASAR